MTNREVYSFDVDPPVIYEPKPGEDESFFGDLQPGKPDPSSKPSIDKLIDINHHLMRRVEELEGIVQEYMSRDIRENLNRMKAREDS